MEPETSRRMTIVGGSVRGRLKRGTSVCGWRAIASIVARRSIVPRALSSWRRRRTGANGSGPSSASFLASSNSPAVIDSKSAPCSRSRSENAKLVSNSLCSSGFFSGAAASASGFGASASARRLERGLLARSPRPLIFGSSSAIIRSSSFGSRQNAAKASSKSACCSWRSIITAESAAWTSSRRARPTASIASSAASTRSGPTPRPAWRRTRAKWTTLSASIGRRGAARRRLQLGEQLGDVAALHLGDVVAVLQEHAERVADVVGREAERVQRDQRVAPVDRLGDAGRLEEVERSQPLHEGDDLRGQPLGRARRADAHDLEFPLEVGIVDPVIEAAALQRVVDLARAVARDDDDRRRLGRGLDGAKLGDRQLVLGQDLEQERVERLVGAIELVDQEHRRARLRQRLQQRA